MKKRMKILSALLLLILLTAGCALNNGARVYDNDELLVKNYNTYNLVSSKQSIDETCLSGSADKLEGMGTIWKFEAADDTDVTITYHLTVSSGKAKLVLISPDDTLTTLAECIADSDTAVEQESSETVSLTKGKNRIKLVGAKNTTITYEISADKGELTAFGS